MLGGVLNLPGVTTDHSSGNGHGLLSRKIQLMLALRCNLISRVGIAVDRMGVSFHKHIGGTQLEFFEAPNGFTRLWTGPGPSRLPES